MLPSMFFRHIKATKNGTLSVFIAVEYVERPDNHYVSEQQIHPHG